MPCKTQDLDTRPPERQRSTIFAWVQRCPDCGYCAAAEDDGKQLSKQKGTDTAILVDLLRRSGQIEQAQKVIAARRGGITEEVIARILDFQATLLDKNDAFCHTIAEVIG